MPVGIEAPRGDAHQDDERALKPQERFEYSAIVDRAPLALPAGARLAICPVVNVEEWEITRPMPRQVSNPPGGGSVVPDIQNWGGQDDGRRVVIWRIFDSLQRRGIVPTLSINARVCETRPRIAEAALAAQWEFMAHCYVQMPIHKIADQRAMIQQSIDVLARVTGKQPRGWLGPGRGQTYATLDYIAEAGFDWFADWVMDDQPFYVKTTHGPLLSIPYSVELNDITIMLTGQHESDAMLKRVRDAFDRMYEEAAGSARILSFGVHPYITGAAHRIRYFDAMLDYLQKHDGVVFWTYSQVHDWFARCRPPTSSQ